jgi:hypothetical protein
MNLKEYMERDFELLQKRVNDVASAYDHQEPGATMSKATAMFDAFTRRFIVEDFLFTKFIPTAEMKPIIEHMLLRRRKVRDKLEDMLMLHVSEPAFMQDLQDLIRMAEEHLLFLKESFDPNVIDKIDESSMNNMSNALEDRLHRLPL